MDMYTPANNNWKDKSLLVLSHSYANFIKNPVEVLARHFKNVTALARYKPAAEISNFLPISFLKPYRKKVILQMNDLPENISVFPIPLWYLPTDLAYQKLGDYHLRESLKAIKKNQITFNLIHSHFTWTAGYVGVGLKMKFQVPLVITAHGYDAYEMPFRSKTWSQKIRNVLNAADRIITVSQRNADCIRRLGIEKTIHVIPNGFSQSLFYPKSREACRRELGLPAEGRIILSIGSLEEVKGHMYLIRAIHQIKDFNNMVCYIIGEGGLRKKLKKLIKVLGLTDKVHLIGQKPHRELVNWYNACDLYVQPSLDEGNPTVMFECLGCGRPFIGTRVGGVPEIIKSDKYGLLCPPGDAHKLADIIQKGLSINWNRAKIQDYSQAFTWETLCKKTAELYAELLSE